MSIPAQIISDDDIVSRWIFDPIHIDKRSGVISITDTFQFPSRPPDLRRMVSVNCIRLLPKNETIDSLGFKTINRSNPQRAIDGKDLLKYMGHIDASVGGIKNMREDFYHFDIVHEPEQDNSAHCHIIFNFNADTDKKSRATYAKKKLYDCFSSLIPPL